jgi:hypothetical protein
MLPEIATIEDWILDANFAQSDTQQGNANRQNGSGSCKLRNHDYYISHDIYLLLKNDARVLITSARSIFRQVQQGLNA